MAHRRGARRADRARDVVRAALPPGRRSTSSTRPAGSWCPSRCSCPRGEQLATALVKGLLRGPGPALGRVVAQLHPAGLDARAVGAGLRRRASPTITLEGDAGPLTAAGHRADARPARLDAAPGARRSERSGSPIGGQPVTAAGRGQRVRASTSGAAYDPTGVAGQPAALRPARRAAGLRASRTPSSPVGGPFGQRPATGCASVGGQPRRRPRSPAVSADGRLGAGRRRSAARAQVRAGRQRRHRPAAPGLGLRRPAVAGRPRAGGRPGLATSRTAGAACRCACPGSPASDVARLPGLARRLPARRRGPPARPATSSWSAGSATTTQGGVLGATRARADLPGSGGDRPRIRDIGWRSPTTVAVLHRLTDELVAGAHRLRRRVARRAGQPVDHAARPGAGAWSARPVADREPLRRHRGRA